MSIKHFLNILLLSITPLWAVAQPSADLIPGKKSHTVIVPANKVDISFKGELTNIPILSNCSYTLSPVWAADEEPWYTIASKHKGKWTIKGNYWYKAEPRKGKMLCTFANGQKQYIDVVQAPNHSFESFQGDWQIKVKTATASSQNDASVSILNTIDGNPNTIYHSRWSTGPTTFPVTLDYIFDQGYHLDYLIYTPRLDQGNGRWGVVTITYTTADAPNEFKTLVSKKDFKYTDSATSVSFGEDGIDNINKVRFTIYTGLNNYAACSEMEFFAYNEEESLDNSPLFTSNLCYKLKPGVTKKDINKCKSPIARQLASYLMHEKYDTLYRVAEFEPFETLETLSRRLKTSQYNRYENPTGIYFRKGVKNMLFVEGIQPEYPVNLIIKDFGGSGSQPESVYPLRNGINVIEPKNLGNGYISYFTDDYQKAPNVRIHFAFAEVNGYFDLERGDTNDDWKQLLANACSDIIDVKTRRLHVAFPTARFKQYCPNNGYELAQTYDSIIYYERQVMGLDRYGIEPKNSQFARVIWSGFMYADGVGAAAHDESVQGWMMPKRKDFGFWGMAHELGHVNQVRPGLKWVGTSETTNNIYSAWVNFKLGHNIHLEREICGIDEYTGMAGGRFNCYLEEGVLRGKPWQKQRGPNYDGDVNYETIEIVDYEGNRLGRDTTVFSVNNDHFVKLVPLWQLQLYCEQAGMSPNMYPKVCQAIRTTNEDGMTDGQLQLKFIRTVCDSTGLNFLPFFEKAGMLQPLRYYVQDYSSGWMCISQAMIDELKQYIADKQYPLPAGEVNYISGINWRAYAERLPLQGTLNEGCSIPKDKRYIKVSHDVWKNAVAFETYNQSGKLLRISMTGLGVNEHVTESINDPIPYTMVLWPKDAAYIQAVGWDGTRITCYAPSIR